MSTDGTNPLASGILFSSLLGNGTLQVTAGASYLETSYVVVAVAPGSSGSLSVDGAGSTLTANYLVDGGGFSAGGTGAVSVTNGAHASFVAGAHLYGGSTLSVDGTGSLLNAGSGALEVDGNSTLLVSGGTLTVSDNADINAGGAVTLESGGVLSVGGTLTVATGATLTIAGGTLDLATANLGGGTIGGFAPGSEIVVANAIGATDGIAVGGGVTTLDLFSGVTQIGSLDFAGALNLSFDSTTGAVTVACFAAGPRIATRRGDVPVETLAVGDQVTLGRRGGRTRPAVWLGHRRIDCRRHPRPRDVWPVRVAAGTFGPGRPQRDLLLSPDHAVYSGGVLIPVRYLINGASIVQEQQDTVTYWHVELEQHDIILAEGLPCESFLDTGNRAAFENGGAVVQLHPDFAPRMLDADACAPIVIAGSRLERVCVKLRERLLVQAAIRASTRRRSAAN
jgi:hypothetical protein